jgi:hypothetical protein
MTFAPVAAASDLGTAACDQAGFDGVNRDYTFRD